MRVRLGHLCDKYGWEGTQHLTVSKRWGFEDITGRCEYIDLQYFLNDTLLVFSNEHISIVVHENNIVERSCYLKKAQILDSLERRSLLEPHE